MMESGYS